MTFLFEPIIPSLAMAGSPERFPVHRIYCVGRNYADHAREMGNDPDREPPFFFSKPADALVADREEVIYPGRTQDLHHEVELVVALGKDAWQVTAQQALDCVLAYAVGIDFTRRDLQAAAKQAGRPWDVAKGFDDSAPVSELQPVSAIGHPAKGSISLSVNGSLRQRGDLADMIWSVPEVIAELSTYYRLRAGDLIFTGTPAGVGRVVAGDVLEGVIEGVGHLRVQLTP
ncbi:MAG: hypothetical protein RLZZ385_1066 [Pseudomonadota bacterium]|jgi:fumarylpyruvate hydrolase